MDEKINSITNVVKKYGYAHIPITEDINLNNIYELLVNNIIFEPNCNIEYLYVGFYYRIIIKDYKLMKKYYLKAIDDGCYMAMCSLAHYYNNKKKYDKMKKYYLMSIDKGANYAMSNLGLYYKEIDNHVEMLKYLTMAYEHGKFNALESLYDYYKDNYDHKKIIMYYMMIVTTTNKKPNLPKYNLLCGLELYLNNQHMYPREKIMSEINALMHTKLNLVDQNKFLMLIGSFDFTDEDHITGLQLLLNVMRRIQ